MTDAEIQPYLQQWVRVTLADGRVLAGKLTHSGGHYTITTPAADKREKDTAENVPGSHITTIEPAPEFGR
jgi:hypothetical protein